jgi:hypothetical protein
MIRTPDIKAEFIKNIKKMDLMALLNFYHQISMPYNQDMQGQILIYNELEARIKAGGR